jgi:hypothetical protein
MERSRSLFSESIFFAMIQILHARAMEMAVMFINATDLLIFISYLVSSLRNTSRSEKYTGYLYTNRNILALQFDHNPHLFTSQLSDLRGHARDGFMGFVARAF